MPKTNYGRWSVGLIFAMFVLFIIVLYLTNTLSKSAPTGDTINSYFLSRSFFEIAMGLSFSAGIAAFVNGLISVFNQKERGVLVYASTIIGAAFTFFTLMNAYFLIKS